MARTLTEVPEDLTALSDEDLHAYYFAVCDDAAAAREVQRRVIAAIRERGWEPGEQSQPSEPAGEGGEAQVAEAEGVESEAAGMG